MEITGLVCLMLDPKKVWYFKLDPFTIICKVTNLGKNTEDAGNMKL